MFIIRLVEEHILAIATFSGPFLEDAFLVDTVFGTQSLPVHGTHLQPKSGFNSASTRTTHFDFHIGQAGQLRSLEALVDAFAKLSRVTIHAML
jgi:hypothetical protein